MLLPKSKIETVELMNEEQYLGDLSYDLVLEEYSFKRNEEVTDLKLYPAEFYGLFDLQKNILLKKVYKEIRYICVKKAFENKLSKVLNRRLFHYHLSH